MNLILRKLILKFFFAYHSISINMVVHRVTLEYAFILARVNKQNRGSHY